jgi:hypothetical protein
MMEGKRLLVSYLRVLFSKTQLLPNKISKRGKYEVTHHHHFFIEEQPTRSIGFMLLLMALFVAPVLNGHRYQRCFRWIVPT